MAEEFLRMTGISKSYPGVVMVSSELSEVLGCCDRILVMKAGRIVAEFSRQDASEQAIMRFAA